MLRLFGISAVPHKTMTLLELGFLESGNAISRSFPIFLIKIFGSGSFFLMASSKKVTKSEALGQKMTHDGSKFLDAQDVHFEN